MKKKLIKIFKLFVNPVLILADVVMDKCGSIAEAFTEVLIECFEYCIDYDSENFSVITDLGKNSDNSVTGNG